MSREPVAPRPTKKLLLVCSSGGHLLQLRSLHDVLWKDYDRAWVSFDKSDTRSLLAGETVHFARFPTNRNLPNLVRNAFLARRVFRAERPDVVISTGAGVALPFLLLAKFFGVKSVYVESFARRTDMSLTGRLVYRFVDHFFVQSEALVARYPRALYRGTIY